MDVGGWWWEFVIWVNSFLLIKYNENVFVNVKRIKISCFSFSIY